MTGLLNWIILDIIHSHQHCQERRKRWNKLHVKILEGAAPYVVALYKFVNTEIGSVVEAWLVRRKDQVLY